MGVKISELTSMGALAGTEKIPGVDSGTQYTTPADLKTYLDAYHAPKYVRAEWMADTHAGYGGTDTKIPYFTNVNINSDIGGSMTVVNNSTNGCKVTINTAGVYAVSFWFTGNADGDQFGISVNGTPTTNIASITASQRRAYSNASGNNRAELVSATMYLAVNDVVRPHTDAQGTAAASLCGFSIVRVA